MVGDGNVRKHEDTAHATPVQFQLEDIHALARKILDNASRQAKGLLDTARKQAVEFERTGYDDGYKNGYNEGNKKGYDEGLAAGDKAAREAVHAACDTLAQSLSVILNDLNRDRQAVFASAEADLLALSLAVARRVVKREVKLDDELALRTVRAALSLTVEKRDILALVNPADLAAVEENLPQLHREFVELERVSARADEGVTRGGARLVLKEGEIDLRIEQQIEALERALLGETKDVG